MVESTPVIPISNLAGKRIALGVSGSIAAYKAADLASKLVQHGAEVDVLMTERATRLVGPDTFAALTQRPVRTGFERWSEDFTGHVSLARDADAMLVAPATASTIARLAQGLADDIIAATALSISCPLLVAPAMEHHMWHHPATQANIASASRASDTCPVKSSDHRSNPVRTGRCVNAEKSLFQFTIIIGVAFALVALISSLVLD